MSSRSLEDRVWSALAAAGKDIDRLTIDDTAPFDQFHTGGKAATLELMNEAGIERSARVLDVGGGVGGPARTLATSIGAPVVVVDIDEAYCRFGASLTRRMGLGSSVQFARGDARALPVVSDAFDVVWMQHSSMSVPDREGLVAEVRRALRSGGTVALQEVVAGPAGPLFFPVPWAADSAQSFVLTADELHDLMESQGFRRAHWKDLTGPLRQRFAQDAAIGTPPARPPLLGVHLLFEPGAFDGWQATWAKNVVEDRARVIRAVYRLT